MKNMMIWVIGCALVGAMGCQSMTGKTASRTMSDAGITASVQAKLTADKVSNFSRIDVDTERGIVTLNGVVQSAQERERAGRLAKEADGIKGLNNNLQVQSQSPQSMN
ncbi:MAG: BON domain-containing protein [Nitrospira sp.]|nr:BON domain-containing protein [Nitrospira sp.]MDR4465441.1 BON domain-containing protein [Nitrospira sp.]